MTNFSLLIIGFNFLQVLLDELHKKFATIKLITEHQLYFT